MKKRMYRLFAFALLATGLITSCSEENATPSAPQVSSEVSILPIKFGETKTFTVDISAAGKLKDVTAVSDIGSVEITEVIGINQATGTATISFTAPFDPGTGTIVITIIDKEGREVVVEVEVQITEQPPVELTAGEVEGVWGPSRTYIVRGDLTIPAGKSLTVLEGVTVIVEGDGTQGNSPGFIVEGNFYSYGTEAKPVLFTVPDSKKIKENIFAGLWGGVLATSNSTEMVIQYTRLEYAGAPAVAGSPIVTSGELAEGGSRFALYFNNPSGKFILQHATIAYTKDDGMRINQGQLLITNNTYIYNGKTGGEALNIKSGSTGDVAYNVFFQAATNGVKWSNSDDRSPQTDVNVYNNTAINCGWRQTKAGRGGSFNLEKGGRGKAFNNIAANCKYGQRFPKSPDNPDIANSSTGYNLYFGDHDDIVLGFYPLTGSIVEGDFETSHDISGLINENDPKFVNCNVTTFDKAAAANADNLDFPPAMDFKLQGTSPALNAGKTDFTTKYTSHTVNEDIYTVPAPSTFIGAFGN